MNKLYLILLPLVVVCWRPAPLKGNGGEVDGEERVGGGSQEEWKEGKLWLGYIV